MSLITCNNVSFAYDGIEVVSDLNFSIDQGDYLCIVGDNGAGKSTLISGLLGLKKPYKGNIVTSIGLQNNEIGYLAQTTNIQKDFPASVYEVVLSGTLNTNHQFSLFYTKKQKELAQKQLQLLGIEKLKNRSFRELSGGQAQRVLLARALCASSKIILLDEPAKGLDPLITNDFYEIIKKLNEEGLTIIMVSHDINYGLKGANKVLHLKNKQLFFGTKEAYFASAIGQAFIGGHNVSNN